MKIKFNALWLLCLLSACTPGELVHHSELELSLEASITPLQPLGRSFDSEGRSSFTTNDSIGFFNQDGKLSSWKLLPSGWNPSTPQHWKDKTSAHNFYAFAPYQKGATLTSISMPELDTQDGTLTQIQEFDFITASLSTTYATATNHAVSFNNTHAFKHIYALISLNLLPSSSGTTITLKGLSIEGSDFFTHTTYNFSATSTSRISKSLPSINKLTINTNTPLTAQGYTSYYLINPSAENRNFIIQITYEQDGQTRTAASSNIQAQLDSGKWLAYTLRFTPEGIILSGHTITGWDKETVTDEIQMTEVNPID